MLVIAQLALLASGGWWGWPMGPFDCRIADAWVLGGYIDILMIMMVVFENVFIVIRCFGLVAT